MAADIIEMRARLLSAPRTQAMVRYLLAQPRFVRWAAPHAPEVIAGALSPNLTARAVIGALMVVWSVARSIAPGGLLAGASLPDVDRMAGLPCFGAAMRHAGWLREVEGGLLLPNFHEHNPPPANARRAAAQLEEVQGGEDFECFWAAYPNKKGKLDALKSWKRLRPGKLLVVKILSALDAQKRSAEWLKEQGKFIPHPATWLNQGRWDDVPLAPPAEKTEARHHKAHERVAEMRAQAPSPEERAKAKAILSSALRHVPREG